MAYNTERMLPSQFSELISAISAGGGGGGTISFDATQFAELKDAIGHKDVPAEYVTYGNSNVKDRLDNMIKTHRVDIENPTAVTQWGSLYLSQKYTVTVPFDLSQAKAVLIQYNSNSKMSGFAMLETATGTSVSFYIARGNSAGSAGTAYVYITAIY